MNIIFESNYIDFYLSCLEMHNRQFKETFLVYKKFKYIKKSQLKIIYIHQKYDLYFNCFTLFIFKNNSKEKIVEEQMQTQKSTLKVKITFESNRISKKHLANAYERLFLISNRQTNNKKQNQKIIGGNDHE